MTDILKHVPEFETCKNLRDAGFPQDTIMVFTKDGDTSMNPYLRDDDGYFIAAPLASEILEIMPFYNLKKHLHRHNGEFSCFKMPAWEIIYHKNPATACALMWLRLRKDGKL